MALTIGDFARLGGVSTRMLRHYDGIGILRPDRVDESSGYRYYSAAQLTRLNRLIAFKDVGFSLDEIAQLLDTDPASTLERLARRRHALAEEIEADRMRLAAVDARMRMIADEQSGAELGFIERPLPALRLTHLSDRVENAGELDSRVGPLFERVDAILARLGIRRPTPPYAWYDTTDESMRFAVGYAIGDEPPGGGLEVTDLAGHPHGLSAVHHGPVRRIGGTWQALAREAESRGFLGDGPGREVYHEAPGDPNGEWVVEIQLPVTPAPA